MTIECSPCQNETANSPCRKGLPIELLDVGGAEEEFALALADEVDVAAGQLSFDHLIAECTYFGRSM